MFFSNILNGDFICVSFQIDKGILATALNCKKKKKKAILCERQSTFHSFTIYMKMVLT